MSTSADQPPFVPPENFQAFTTFLRTSPPPRFVEEFVCSAWRGGDPTLIGATPIGLCKVYDGFLAFITDSKAKIGSLMAVGQSLLDDMQPFLMLSRWVNFPPSVALDVLKRLGSPGAPPERQALMAAGLTSPNSIYLPFDDIWQIRGERTMRGNFIRIRTRGGADIVLYNNFFAACPDPLRYLLGKRPVQKFSFFGGLKFMADFVTGDWHADTVAFINAEALRRGRAAAKARKTAATAPAAQTEALPAPSRRARRPRKLSKAAGAISKPAKKPGRRKIAEPLMT